MTYDLSLLPQKARNRLFHLRTLFVPLTFEEPAVCGCKPSEGLDPHVACVLLYPRPCTLQKRIQLSAPSSRRRSLSYLYFVAFLREPRKSARRMRRSNLGRVNTVSDPRM